MQVKVLITLIVVWMCTWLCSTFSSAQSPFDNNLFLHPENVIIFAPHPDDEILGFAGVIYDAVKMKKELRIVILTNGDGYGSACYFWKNGIPRDDTSFHGQGCTPDELERYGLARIEESKKALAVLGADSTKVTVLGYPDGWIGEMLRHPDSVFRGNTSRRCSFTGKLFSAGNLLGDVKEILRSRPGAEIYTVHGHDAHDDHASLAAVIQDARRDLVKEDQAFQLWFTMIHEPGGDNNLWPNPVCDWDIYQGDWMVSREKRYTPWEVLQPPPSEKTTPEIYFIREQLWNEEKGTPPLMRQAMDLFETGIGTTKSDGAPVTKGYEGWMDRNGYLISFIKRNHLFWKADEPALVDSIMGSCRRNPIAYSLNLSIPGNASTGMNGDCSCRSEVFPGEGIRVGSGLSGGRVWYDIGPVFQDSVIVEIVWADNSWAVGTKRLEIFNWQTNGWDVFTEMKGNDLQHHTTTFKVKLSRQHQGALQKIRIGFTSMGHSRGHIRSVMVR